MRIKNKYYKLIAIILLIIGISPYIGLSFSGIISHIINVLLILIGVFILIKK